MSFSPRPPPPHLPPLCPSPSPRAQEEEHVYIKRVAGEEFYAELSIFSGDKIARLAERACAKFPRWGAADAGQVRLFLVKRGGKLPTPEMEAAATPLEDPSDTLVYAGIVSGSWLLARVSLPATAAGASWRGGLVRTTMSARAYLHLGAALRSLSPPPLRSQSPRPFTFVQAAPEWRRVWQQRVHPSRRSPLP